MADRLLEFLIIELAMLEVEYEMCRYDYFWDLEEETHDEVENPNGEASELLGLDSRQSTGLETTKNLEDPIGKRLGGPKIEVYEDEDRAPSFDIQTTSKYKKGTAIHNDLLVFLLDLQDAIGNGDLPIFTEYKRGGTLFHSHPNKRVRGPGKIG